MAQVQVKTVRILQKDVKLIEDEAALWSPLEACGILVGQYSDDTALVREVVTARNVREERNQFEIDPERLYHCWKECEETGREIIGFYHSHPGGLATPSAWDKECMEATPLVWLILGKDGLKAYQWDETIKDARRVKLEIERV